MRAVQLHTAYQAKSASAAEQNRYGELFRSNIVAFRLKTKKLDVEPHSGGLSLKAAFAGSESYEFRDTVATVGPGEVMLVRPTEVYQSSISSRVETDSFSLFFPFEFYRQMMAACRHRSLQRFLDSGASSTSFPVNSGFVSVLHKLAAAFEGQESDLAVEQLIASLQDVMGIHVEEITEGYSKIRMRSVTLKAERLRRVMRAREFLHTNFGRDVTLAELAGEACMSEFHFLRSFNEAFGATPARYVERLKIARARDLLGNSRLPVKVVASQSGYGNFSAFCRSFRRTTGMTPRMFRIEHINQTSGE